MADFKLKIVLGEATIELEGEGQLVKEIFNDLKSNGLGVLTTNKKFGNRGITSIDTCVNNEIKNDFVQTENPYPLIQDVIMADYAQNGQEKLLVFAFYSSDYGSRPITHEEIKQFGKDNNCPITNNFNYYYKALIKDKYLKSCNSESCMVTQKGKEFAIKIINNENEVAEKKKTKIQKPVIKYDLVELHFNDKEKRTLLELFQQHQNLSNIDKILLATNFYKDNKDDKIVNKDIIFTILKNANVSTSFSIKDALSNAKKKNYFFSGQNKGEYELSHIGEEYVENNLLIQGE